MPTTTGSFGLPAVIDPNQASGGIVRIAEQHGSGTRPKILSTRILIAGPPAANIGARKNRALFIPMILCLAACDQDLSSRRVVTLGAHEYQVMRLHGRPTAYYASAAQRFRHFARPFAGVLPGNVAAIEAVSGCPVIPETVHHLDGISTEAEVRC